MYTVPYYSEQHRRQGGVEHAGCIGYRTDTVYHAVLKTSDTQWRTRVLGVF